MVKNTRAQLQISFGWLFAIVAGIFILALAIYASVKFIDIGQQTTGAESIAEIGVLLNPLETSFETSTTNTLEFPTETRIKNTCNSFTMFGTQRISLAQKSFGKFEDIDTEGSFKNKYIFSNESTQGEEFYLFSKTFEMPFQVASLIYLTSAENEYCFVNSSTPGSGSYEGMPEELEEELNNLNQRNIKIGSESMCEEDSIRVCFDTSIKCDINVDTFQETVIKETPNGIEEMYYETDALMLAAIFSSEEVYECQIKRLMDRVSSLSLIYDGKASILSQKDCRLSTNPRTLANSADSLEDSEDLILVANAANTLDNQNKASRCRLW